MSCLNKGILRFGSPLLCVALVACGGSGSDSVALDPAIETVESLGAEEIVLSLEPIEITVARSISDVIVVTPASLDLNGDFFVGVGEFTPGITVFNASDLLVAGVLEADYLAQGSLLISYSPAQNQTIITLRNRVTGFRVRIRGADFRGQISLANFIFDQPTLVPGFGSDPVPGSPIDVGMATIGQPTTATLTIRETGTAQLNVTAGVLSGTNEAEFVIDPKGAFSIADGGPEVKVTITCTPDDLGIRTATLAFTTNDPNNATVNYDLECEGLAIPVSIFESTPIPGSTIDLGSAILNTATGSQTLKISNTGTAKLEVGAAQLTGANKADFTISPNMAIDIEVSGSSEDVTISCTPTALGSRTAKLEFTTNDPNRATVSYDLKCEGEATASLLVNTLDDEDGTNPNKCSLREAIIANNKGEDFWGCADPDGTIKFDPALTGTIKLTAKPAQITEDVMVKGPGSSVISVSGDNQFRVFDIGSNPNVTIDGLTITNGSTSGNGGGILAGSGTTLTVSNSTLSDNSAGSSGGGIRAFSATVRDSTLTGNSANLGGGGITAETVTVTSSTLEGNTTGADGGGILAITATVSNSTLEGNSAGSNGGGIRAFRTTVSDSTLNGNSAGNNGGGIRLTASTSTATISDSQFSGNTAVTSGVLSATHVER